MLAPVVAFGQPPSMSSTAPWKHCSPRSVASVNSSHPPLALASSLRVLLSSKHWQFSSVSWTLQWISYFWIQISEMTYLDVSRGPQVHHVPNWANHDPTTLPTEGPLPAVSSAKDQPPHQPETWRIFLLLHTLGLIDVLQPAHLLWSHYSCLSPGPHFLSTRGAKATALLTYLVCPPSQCSPPQSTTVTIGFVLF